MRARSGRPPCRWLPDHHDAALERRRQGECRDLELDLAGLDLGEVEDVVDQGHEMPSRGEDVVEVLGLLVIDLAVQLLPQDLRETADRVQRRPQLVRHVGQELRLVAARGFELTGLLVQPGKGDRELPCPLLDLLLEAGVGLLQPFSHPVEFRGKGSELVTARDLDPLIEGTGADPRCGDLDRLDRLDEVAGQQHARRDREEEEDGKQQRCPPDRRLDRRERLAERLLDEDPPTGRIDPLVGAEHLCPA